MMYALLWMIFGAFTLFMVLAASGVLDRYGVIGTIETTKTNYPEAMQALGLWVKQAVLNQRRVKMATSVKVPKEVMELFYEAEACRSLAEAYRGWLPSLKAIYYRQKAVKAEMLGWRALRSTHVATTSGEWNVDLVSGLATKKEDPNAPKKTRAARKPKAPATPATAAPAAKQGEVK